VKTLNLDKFTLTREDAVLMIIDIQERLVPVMNYRDQVMRNTNTLLATATKLNIPIIFTEQNSKGLGKTVPELNTGQGRVFEKITFCGSTKEMLAALNLLARKKIIVVGMETHVCVLQTVRGLLEHWYHVFVVSDAVCSRTKENYKNGLSQMMQMGSVVTNTETVFFDLLKQANTPEFRELLPLVKD